jgi:hypothetical protein
MSAADTYSAQAEQARRDAAASPLPNVRERLERSAAAWQDMANRAERTEASRSKRADDAATAAAFKVATEQPA